MYILQIDSQVLTELVVNLQTLTNEEISQGISRIQNRLLPVPNPPEMSSRRRYRPQYLNPNRRSMSLHNLMDTTQDSFNPLRDGLSLQGLYSSSHTLDIRPRNGTQYDGPEKRRHLSNCEENQVDEMNSLENGNSIDFLNAKVRKDYKTIRDGHSAEAKSETLNKDVLLLYDDARENITNENSNET
ncbi:hypothetical protein ACJMK2_026179 [Sinanodonta woodiana]|uniref:Uncharacterized protein n=1 Tax=Sinanodonta woodiana TaxID=1069815 RepID=A0ABD3XKA4_SINWO